jgi:hypothetical protein
MSRIGKKVSGLLEKIEPINVHWGIFWDMHNFTLWGTTGNMYILLDHSAQHCLV